MLRIAPAFTNYVSATVENKYLFRTGKIWDSGFGNRKSKEGAYTKWENHCSVLIRKICERLLIRI